MEQARMLLAVVLSFLVFFLWQYFFVDEQAVQKQQQTQTQTEIASEPDASVDSAPVKKTVEPIVEPSPVPSIQPSVKDYIPKIITVDAPLYKVQISDFGAAFVSFELKKFKEYADPDASFKQMVPSLIKNGTLWIHLKNKSIQGLHTAVFETNQKNDLFMVDEQNRQLTFTWTSPEGFVLEKTYTFHPNSYLIDLTVTVKNGTPATIQDEMLVSLDTTYDSQSGRYSFQGPAALINNQLEQIKVKKLKDQNVFSGKIGWASLQDRYFMQALIPENGIETSIQVFFNQNNLLSTNYIQPQLVMHSGTQHQFNYHLFFGPKKIQTLREIGFDLDKNVNFGMFTFIAKPCLWLMNQIYAVIPNYGVAIILLTLLTKIILWPLGNKSYKSMNQMKKLQPLMADIREKYKNDKKKMNEELMNLYRTYKINPMGGCLPMVAQIPIFFALYRMLYEAIELRHAPFFGWITDLSAPDRLFNFGFSIPFMDPPYGIPVLTLIMGATMFFQQKMSPPPGDPTQAKMMMFLPIVFTFIFINFSAGLVLYWLVNNVLSISQQYYISKKQN
jgi:YidC/Oxa1 family membrane protein insertase